MRLLKSGFKAIGMNIQHPIEQANRLAAGVVMDEVVPQCDNFAKHIVGFFKYPVPALAFLNAVNFGLNI